MSQAEQRCPACGKANQCAQAGKSQPVTDCWCFHQRLSEQALQRLRQLDSQARSCLCPACAKALIQAV